MVEKTNNLSTYIHDPPLILGSLQTSGTSDRFILLFSTEYITTSPENHNQMFEPCLGLSTDR